MKIRANLGALILLLTSVQASAISTVATINGLDWAGLGGTARVFEEFTPSNSAAEIIDICGGPGPCDGTTSRGYDLTGWFLANEIQVTQLFNEVLGTSNGNYIDVAPWFDIFGSTGHETGVHWSSAAYLSGSELLLGRVEYCTQIQCLVDSRYDLISTGDPLSFYDGYGTAMSLFLYQPSPVPVPAAIWLFGTALIGLIGIGNRKTRSSA